jgi:adenylosuccinate lyase
VIPNVLAERYASPALQAIWSAEGRIVLEREFWIAVMKAQRDLGLDVPEEAIAAYEAGQGPGGHGRRSWRGKRSPAMM